MPMIMTCCHRDSQRTADSIPQNRRCWLSTTTSCRPLTPAMSWHWRCSILALLSTQSITPFCCRRCCPDFQWPVIRWIGSDPISQVAPSCSSHSRLRRHRFHWCPACPKAPVLAQLSSSRTLNVSPMSFRRTVYGTISLRMTPSATIPAQSPPHAFSLC